MKSDLRELAQRDILLTLEYTKWNTAFELLDEMKRARNDGKLFMDASEQAPKVTIQQIYDCLRALQEDGWVECRYRNESDEVIQCRNGCRRLEWGLSRRGDYLREGLVRFMELRMQGKEMKEGQVHAKSAPHQGI